MKCHYIKDYLVKHPFTEDDPEIHDHLMSCNECADFHSRFSRIIEQFRHETESNESPFLRAKILDKLQNTVQARKKPGMIPLPVLRYAVQGIAAVALVATGVLLGTQYAGKYETGNFTSEDEKYRYYSELFYLDEFHVENIEAILMDNTNK